MELDLEKLIDKKSWFKQLEKDLSGKRYDHTIRVAETAVILARAHGYNERKAAVAGILHDCAKNYKDSKLIHCAEKYRIPMSQASIENTDLLHAKVGAWIAKDHYHVNDADVFNAIAYHTTGRPSMGMLEKIIYVSDYIEPGRKHRGRLDMIREVAFEDLNRAVFFILEDTLAFLLEKAKTKDPMTFESYHYYKQLKEGFEDE